MTSSQKDLMALFNPPISRRNNAIRDELVASCFPRSVVVASPPPSTRLILYIYRPLYCRALSEYSTKARKSRRYKQPRPPLARLKIAERTAHPMFRLLSQDATSATASCGLPVVQKHGGDIRQHSDGRPPESPYAPYGSGQQEAPPGGNQASPWSPAPSFASTVQFSPGGGGTLADTFRPATPARTYHLEVVQHPVRTAEFGSASLSRLPLSPPMVVQLIVRDRIGNNVIPEMELPFLIAHLSLYSADGRTALDMGNGPGDSQTPRRLLYGNIVSSPQKLRDLQGRLGLYFLFPDVSIRWRGRFQLAVTLVQLFRSIDSSGSISMAERGTILAEARTRPFDVLPHENYVAPRQTQLTQSFLRQGARMYTSSSNLQPH